MNEDNDDFDLDPELTKAESYTPPESARNNAKRAFRWKEEHGDEVKAMTATGWTRARQLASGKGLSLATVKRMAAFNRHRKNSKVDPKYKDEPWKDNGYVAWLGWGGTSGIDWAMKISEANKSVTKARDDTPPGRRRRIMKEFSIAEISAVDEPAQDPARMTIMKAKGQGINPPGEPAPVNKKEDSMSKTAEELQAELEKMAKDRDAAVAKAEAVELLAKMSDREKKYTAGMSKDEKKKFMDKSEDERSAMMDDEEEAKKAKNPVVYKAKDGTEYRKSDDQRLVEMAKRDDAREEEMAKMREDAANAAFEKSAMVDFAKFKGELSAKTALAKAVAGIKDEDARKSVKEMLKSAHAAVALTLKEVGGAGDDYSSDDLDGEVVTKAKAENQLDAMAKKYATENKVDYAKAYTAVLETDEGQALYAKTVA